MPIIHNDDYYYIRGLTGVLTKYQGHIRHEQNKSKIGQERNYQVIGPLHECKKVCPCTKSPTHSGICA